jgi:hypothetical protein
MSRLTTELSRQRFLIIAGTSKAGTTSVFNYLATHPQICPSSAKETRFFLDVDYPLPSKRRYEIDGLEAYLSFFDDNGAGRKEAWRLEATPDYLYSPSTPRVIREALPNVHLIFLLREPASRLLSFYRFGQAMNEIPLTMTFDQYVELQSDNLGPTSGEAYQHPAFFALQHGRYSVYLKPFLELFGRSSLHILFYEELRRDPLSFMTTICRSTGIDELYFRSYSFDVLNRTVDVWSPFVHQSYFKVKDGLRRWVRHTPSVRSCLRPIRRGLDGAYKKLNLRKSKKISISRSTELFLRSYYKNEPVALKKLFGIEVPWP